MKPAPLQLVEYWALSTHVDANPDYNPSGKAMLDIRSVEVTHEVTCLDKESSGATKWLIDLVIKQDVEEPKNTPYSFEIHMQGIVLAHPNLKGNKLQQLMSVNGPAMLFGAAREVIRAATGRGPFKALIIPSTNFIPEDKETLPESEVKSKKTVKKKRVNRKKQ